MAGTYKYAKSRKELLKKMRHTTPFGAKLTISRAPSLDKRAPKGKKAFYTIIDVRSKSGKLLYHS
ncbi:hypothetical protein CMI47_14060 [Candidatus Pacearchaeota archaeon]|jgi:hypothetical protein|nr:hypothetical protein [Candidatus Pacearchaeota archaeon]|tara:strand:+ start:164 stop:358 length:195 start_codon:yes stop_codon:yes gene_type:complete